MRHAFNHVVVEDTKYQNLAQLYLWGYHASSPDHIVENMRHHNREEENLGKCAFFHSRETLDIVPSFLKNKLWNIFTRRSRWTFFILCAFLLPCWNPRIVDAIPHEETLALVTNHALVGERNPPWDEMIRMNVMSLIYTLPSAPFQAYMTLSSIFTLVLFHGSSSLFSGQTHLPETSIFVHKKDIHKLASQLMSSPHMYAHPCLESSNSHLTRLDHSTRVASPSRMVKSHQLYDMEYPHKIWQR